MRRDRAQAAGNRDDDQRAPGETRDTVRLSVIVPATNAPPTLERCIAAVRAAGDGPDEVIVIDTPTGLGPAGARNLGADRASGDVLVFVDADVEVHEDVFRRFRAAFSENPRLVAVFGSYDDEPDAPETVSSFRNLLHHHVHHHGKGRASTFWAGLGAVRRDAFLSAGGFDEERYPRPSIEDIELGMRLAASGASLRLDPRIQGKHLKRWTLSDMVRTDFAARGVPWIGLLLKRGSESTGLNLGWRHRLSAVSSVLAVVGIVARRYRLAVSAIGLLLALNASFYRLLYRKRGLLATLSGVGLHAVHHLTGVAASIVGLVKFARERAGRSAGESESRGRAP